MGSLVFAWMAVFAGALTQGWPEEMKEMFTGETLRSSLLGVHGTGDQKGAEGAHAFCPPITTQQWRQI